MVFVIMDRTTYKPFPRSRFSLFILRLLKSQNRRSHLKNIKTDKKIIDESDYPLRIQNTNFTLNLIFMIQNQTYYIDRKLTEKGSLFGGKAFAHQFDSCIKVCDRKLFLYLPNFGCILNSKSDQ